jgi:hypothetical protein
MKPEKTTAVTSYAIRHQLEALQRMIDASECTPEDNFASQKEIARLMQRHSLVPDALESPGITPDPTSGRYHVESDPIVEDYFHRSRDPYGTKREARNPGVELVSSALSLALYLDGPGARAEEAVTRFIEMFEATEPGRLRIQVFDALMSYTAFHAKALPAPLLSRISELYDANPELATTTKNDFVRSFLELRESEAGGPGPLTQGA